MSLLRVINISKKYKLQDGKERVVLNNVSINFSDTGLVAILGKSGSGKSTLLNMISLLDEPTNGCIYFKQRNINRFDQKDKEEYRNRNIGMVFQHYHLLENETVLFNIMFPQLIKGEKAKKAEIAAKNLLKTIDFKENLYLSKCKDLSGGEKERVAILRALVNNPEIILADEPTGALDSKNSILVMELLKQISKERLVIVISHNEQLINKYTHTINNITFNRYRVNIDKIHNEEGIVNLNRGTSRMTTNNIEDKDKDAKKEIDIKEKDYSSDIDFFGTIPTLQEVKDFITLKQLPIDAEDFYNYYSSIGWMQNNSPIKNWQYKALQWGKREGMKNGLKDIAAKQQTPIQQRQCDYKFGEIEISDDEI